ncbi:hypothetical protein BTE56_12755 [Agrobacterium pusense]|nr:hypothetical protein BTE56_12755 [Agrobacterium pusense]
MCGSTPLCPAGHLPLKGGDRQEALPPLHSQVLRWARLIRLPISPLEGEMPGRAEGGKATHTFVSLKINIETPPT